MLKITVKKFLQKLKKKMFLSIARGRFQIIFLKFLKFRRNVCKVSLKFPLKKQPNLTFYRNASRW